jgi:uncharacterized coiled-coil DUF342 family protein
MELLNTSEEYKEKIVKLNNELSKMKGVADEKLSENRRLESKVTELKTECDSYKKSFNDTKTDNNKLHLHIKHLLSQAEQYQRKLERLSQCERTMQDSLRSSMDSIQQIEVENTRLTAENEELKKQQVEYMNERSVLISQSNDLKLQLIKTQQLTEELNNEMLIHKEHIEATIPKTEELQQYANKLRQELIEIKESNKNEREEYEIERKKFNDKLKELMKVNRKYVKEIETLGLDNKKLKVTSVSKS